LTDPGTNKKRKVARTNLFANKNDRSILAALGPKKRNFNNDLIVKISFFGPRAASIDRSATKINLD